MRHRVPRKCSFRGPKLASLVWGGEIPEEIVAIAAIFRANHLTVL